MGDWTWGFGTSSTKVFLQNYYYLPLPISFVCKPCGRQQKELCFPGSYHTFPGNTAFTLQKGNGQKIKVEDEDMKMRKNLSCKTNPVWNQYALVSSFCWQVVFWNCSSWLHISLLVKSRAQNNLPYNCTWGSFSKPTCIYSSKVSFFLSPKCLN